MSFKRYIVEDLVEPELAVEYPPPPESDEPQVHERYRRACKERVIEALAALFDRSGQIRNLSKFTREFKQRENASTSAIGGGIAIPHLRSMQPRRLVVAVARSTPGLEYLAPDEKPVHLFFCLTAPPYDDRLYLRFHRWVAAELIAETWLIEALMQATSAHEMVKILRGLYY